MGLRAVSRPRCKRFNLFIYHSTKARHVTDFTKSDILILLTEFQQILKGFRDIFWDYILNIRNNGNRDVVD